MKSFNFLLNDKMANKPRKTGLTMVLDKGLGLETAESLMKISGEYVDLLKFGWGTSIVHEQDIIKAKVEMYKSYDIVPYTGGTLFELAYQAGKLNEYFAEAHNLGFEAIEISDGSTIISIEDKIHSIEQSRDEGFMVLSEVGKKDPNKDKKLSIAEKVDLMNKEISAGASYVIVEAREGGKNIGVFDEKGEVKTEEVDFVMKHVDSKKILWEAPNKNQQVFFILNYGSNVNLGNISIDDITSLETLRRGLRGDTIGKI